MDYGRESKAEGPEGSLIQEDICVETPNIRNGRLHLSLMAWLGWQLGFLKATEWFPVIILEYTVMGYLVAHRRMFQLRVQFGSLMASSLEVQGLWWYSAEDTLDRVWPWPWRAGRVPGPSPELEGCSNLNSFVHVHGVGVGWKGFWRRKFLQQPERESDLKISSNLIS